MLDSSNTDPAVLDPERLRALRETELLDSPPEEAFDRLTELVRRVLGVPVSLVSLVDADRQFFKSHCGLEEPWASERETPLSHSFCQHVVASGEPLVVECATLHPLVRTNLAIRDLGVISYIGIPLTSPDGHVLGSLCAIDSTTRVWSEEDVDTLRSIAGPVMTEIAVRAQAKKLHVANAAKDRFFSIVAHDLRSPLQTVLGYASIIAHACSHDPDSQLSHFATRLDTSAQNLGQVLDSLLQWTLVQNGNVKCTPAHFSIDESVRAAVDLVFEQAEQKGVNLLPIADSQLTVQADATLVTCVVNNLLTNAIKFTPKGGEVRVQVEQVGTEVRVTVEDDGIGIPDDLRPELFKIDHKASRTGTDNETGTGLGLIICRDLVELNGGKIWADGEPGNGTKMHFTLPGAEHHEMFSGPTVEPNADRESTAHGFARFGLKQEA